MMKYIVLMFMVFGGLVVWNSAPKAAFSQDLDLVVVELFTSQSCSSCSPADKNLAALSEHGDVIALGFHVTYWNHLHWKDTLSREFATERQRNYARFKSDGRVYTPQMVVNGRDEFVGNNVSKIEAGLEKADKVEPIEVAQLSEEQLKAVLPQVQSGTYTLWIAGVQDAYTQYIPSGENRGKTITYRNAVLRLDKGQNWDGSAQEMVIDVTPKAEVDSYVVLVQKDGYGAIVAAGRVE